MRKLGLIFATSTLLMSCSKVDELTPRMKENLADLAREHSGVLKEPFRSDDPYILAFFFEIDGVQLAFTSSAFDKYSDLRGWQEYRLVDGKWQSPKVKYSNADMHQVADDNCVVGFPDEFYILTEDGQKPKLVVINLVNQLDGDNKIRLRGVRHITIDAEGYLKVIPMPEMEIEARYSDVTHRAELKPISQKGKLEPVQVETFYPKGFEKKINP